MAPGTLARAETAAEEEGAKAMRLEGDESVDEDTAPLVAPSLVAAARRDVALELALVGKEQYLPALDRLRSEGVQLAQGSNLGRAVDDVAARRMAAGPQVPQPGRDCHGRVGSLHVSRA